MKILCPLDGTQQSLAVLPALQAFGGLGNVSVVLLVVVEPESRSMQDPITTTGPGAIFRTTMSGRMRETEHANTSVRAELAAQEYLGTAAAALRQAGLTIERRVIIEREPVEAIVRVAMETEADLIAMATGKSSGVPLLRRKSVSGAVLDAGVAPVLLVRATGRM